jgi:hypothetical protein
MTLGTSNSIYDTIMYYDKYYKINRSQRQIYIMSKAVDDFLSFYNLKPPNLYIIYLVVDKAILTIRSKSTNGRISELTDELIKDFSILSQNAI